METRKEQMLIEDAMVLMSGDMFTKVYELKNDFVFVKETIKSWARSFVDELKRFGYKADGSDELDFVFELEKFEDKMFEELKKMF